MSHNSSQVITRFAPSPTGYLHIGGARTALYNYLFTRRHGGKFILRIEDTDRERSTPESIQAILDGMKWLGLTWDDGPFFQSKRTELYQKAIVKLLEENKAYACFCSSEELDAKRKQAQQKKIKYIYDRTCWKLTPGERAKKIKNGLPHVIRFYSKDGKTITVHDHIKGRVRMLSDELDDLIIRRTDGGPTYNLTVVVDDMDMAITHVIRGDDHLNNTPRQIQLYEALGYPMPEFAHLPMICGADKKLLSKRHGATSVMAYRDMGYLPHALLNYLVRLGWSFKDQEIFTIDEMIQNFSFEGCSPSSAIFNPDKLNWLNGHYIRESKPENLAGEVKYHLQRLGATHLDEKKLLHAVTIGQPKVKTLKELAEFISLFFMDVPVDTDVIEKNVNDANRPCLKRLCEELKKLTEANQDSVRTAFEKVMAEFGVTLGKVAGPARAVLSGRKISPGVFEMIEIFGVGESIKRLGKAL